MPEQIFFDEHYSAWVIVCECPVRANEIRAIVSRRPSAFNAEQNYGEPTLFRTYESALRAVHAGARQPVGVLV